MGFGTFLLGLTCCLIGIIMMAFGMFSGSTGTIGIVVFVVGIFFVIKALIKKG